MRNNGDNIISPKKADIKSKSPFYCPLCSIHSIMAAAYAVRLFRIDVVHLLKKYCFSIITPNIQICCKGNTNNLKKMLVAL